MTIKDASHIPSVAAPPRPICRPKQPCSEDCGALVRQLRQEVSRLRTLLNTIADTSDQIEVDLPRRRDLPGAPPLLGRWEMSPTPRSSNDVIGIVGYATVSNTGALIDTLA